MHAWCYVVSLLCRGKFLIVKQSLKLCRRRLDSQKSAHNKAKAHIVAHTVFAIKTFWI